MNSWYQLLLWNMSQGKYLSKREFSQYDWAVLWALIQESQAESYLQGVSE